MSRIDSPDRDDTKCPFKANVQEAMKQFVEKTVEKGIDKLLKEYNELKKVSATAKQVNRASFDRNPTKNRYRDIPCIEESRVHLKFPPKHAPYDEKCSDTYIHANYIDDVPGIPKITDPKKSLKVIATQGPLPDTVEDFWRMIWQDKITAIVMLCGVYEGGKKKCENYLPEKIGGTLSVLNGDLNIVLVGYQNLGKENLRFSMLNMQNIRKTFTKTGSQITGIETKAHSLTHMYWDGWPDKGVPMSAISLLRLLHQIQDYNKIVVHCSAGVGRTGAITAVYAALKFLTAGKELNMYELVRQIRTKRFLACQTDLQYLYIHLAVMTYICSKHVLPMSKIKDFQASYEALVKERLDAGKE